MTINPAADLMAATKQEPGRRPAGLEFQAERYLADLDDFDLSREQKTELLDALWQIMRTFVELGVGSDLSAQVLRDAGLLPPTSKEG